MNSENPPSDTDVQVAEDKQRAADLAAVRQIWARACKVLAPPKEMLQ